MKLLKRISLIVITFIIITLIYSIQNGVYRSSISAIANPPNVGVLLFNSNDPFIAAVEQNLRNIEKENPSKVRFSFYNAKDNQAIQNADIDALINSKIDLLLVNLVDTKKSTVSEIINKANTKNIPLIFFNIELPINAKIAAGNVIVIATDSGKSGEMQGKILVDLWNTNKGLIDKNRDNVMQYIMLQGKTNNEAAINRTIYSVSTLNDNGIKTQELALTVCNWERECAKNAISSLFLKYAGNIEAIIANNDAMAVGAIDALQAYGYNIGDKTRTIPVVGIDAIPEARDLIEKGFMAGTVIQDPKDFAKALYSVGLNLVYKKEPLEGTDYRFDEQGMIELPYYEYIP